VRVCAGMVGEIVCVFHDPTALLGLLPSIDRGGCIDVRIFHIAHGKGMERDLHAHSVADTVLLTYEFCCHRKHSCDHFSTGSRHDLMFLLRTIGTPELYEMHP